MATDYLVEEFMMGPEISVDALIQKGKVTIMGIQEQIRMKPPYFIQVSGTLPYRCPAHQMRVIKKLISETAQAMGIRNSATHTEIIFTKDGPKIVEIGCRFGGDELHDTILACTGYSMMFESVMIALGIKRDYRVKNVCHTAMQYLLPKRAGTVRNVEIHPKLLKDSAVNEVFMYVEVGDEVAPPPSSFDYLGYVSVSGTTPALAQKKLKAAVKKIRISISHE